MRRIGRWIYGAHAGLNPGWRLDDSDLVLDFDPRQGCYVLWTAGRPGQPIDRYLDGAMRHVENTK